jgi:S-adenosylmethionine:tRNA ribosyltransferase-isomerase
MNRSNLPLSPASIAIEDFNYELPDEKIAKHPLEVRDACKLLVRSHDGEISEHTFSELPALLPANSMLIYNNTRVINARLRFRKASANVHQEGALIEIFCLEPVHPADYAQSFASDRCCSWTCFVGNSKRWKEGPLTMEITIGNEHLTLAAERLSREGNASVVNFSWDNPNVTFSQLISAVGEIPIPPYLNRSTEASDSKDYQTVYSRIEGSVAAPTAGLHFTERVLQEISARGIQRHELTLHVGAGTFQPVKSELIGDHPMHAEFFAVPLPLLRELASLLSPSELSSASCQTTISQPSPSDSSQAEAPKSPSSTTVAEAGAEASPSFSNSSQSEAPLSPSSSTVAEAEAEASPSPAAPSRKKIIAVGTTSVRTLESLYHAGKLILQGTFTGEIPQWTPYESTEASEPTPAEAIQAIIKHMEKTGEQTFIAATRIIIAPGYQYRIVDGIVTNFHQPKSTLLLLVSAFTKGDWRPMYDYALAHNFRFLSYGDASLLL